MPCSCRHRCRPGSWVRFWLTRRIVPTFERHSWSSSVGTRPSRTLSRGGDDEVLKGQKVSQGGYREQQGEPVDAIGWFQEPDYWRLIVVISRSAPSKSSRTFHSAKNPQVRAIVNAAVTIRPPLEEEHAQQCRVVSDVGEAGHHDAPGLDAIAHQLDSGPWIAEVLEYVGKHDAVEPLIGQDVPSNHIHDVPFDDMVDAVREPPRPSLDRSRCLVTWRLGRVSLRCAPKAPVAQPTSRTVVQRVGTSFATSGLGPI